MRIPVLRSHPRIRHRRIAVASGLLLVLTSLGGSVGAQSTPQPEPPPDLTNAERRGLAGMVLRGLEATYAGDRTPLALVATPAAIDALTAIDWRTAATADGGLRYLADLSSGAVLEMEPIYATEGVVKESLELRIEAAPGARLVDATDRVIEVSTGSTWWALGVTFERDAVGAPWRITGFNAPTDLDLRFDPLPEAAPCPWDPATRRQAQGDPFLLGPWCDVNGRGRMVPGRDDVPRGQSPAISVIAGASHCDWEDLRFLTLGWPIGAPIDGWTAGRYVRDPAGELTDGGFGADVPLPEDAVATGITNGRATIWTSEAVGRRAIFVAVDGRIERWPRTWAACA